MRDLKQALKAFTGFDLLGDVALEEVARFVSIRTVRAGETVFCQGEPSPYCFGVLSGEVNIQRASSDRRYPMKLLGVVGPGGLFGESCLFDDSPRVAMASATKDGELVVIRGTEFRNWIRKHAEASQPVLLSLLRLSIGRLHRTNLELSVVYGIGRLLGSGKPFLDQLNAAFDFLKGSLEGLDSIALYQRSSYWDEFEAILTLPLLHDMPAVPIQNELIQSVNHSGTMMSFEPRRFHAPLEAFRLGWEEHAAIAIIPLFNWEMPSAALQGILLLTSMKNPQAFSFEKQLLLSSLALPLTEALARQNRIIDAEAQSRLTQSRQTYQG